MNIAEININSMDTLMGNIFLLTTGEEIKDVYITLSKLSKEKLAKTLLSQNVSRENQDLTISELFVNRNFDNFLQKGQSTFTQKNNVYSYTPQSRNPARFKGVFQTIVNLKCDSSTVVAVRITLGNFDFDFSNAQKELVEEEVVYRNVNLTIYPSRYTITILEDE